MKSLLVPGLDNLQIQELKNVGTEHIQIDPSNRFILINSEEGVILYNLLKDSPIHNQFTSTSTQFQPLYLDIEINKANIFS